MSWSSSSRCVVMVGVFLSVGATASGQQFAIRNSTVDGGGGVSSGGTFVLRSTIGQADAGGPQIGGTYELTGGFWPAVTTPIECLAPVVAAAGSRALSITPSGEALQALRVVGQSGGSIAVGCVDTWVQADGSLGSDPAYLTSAEWTMIADVIPGNGMVEASGLEIVAGATYSVAAECLGPSSAGALATTYGFADVNNSGITNLEDSLIIILGIEGDPPDGITTAEMDIDPCLPNGVVNLGDALLTILAIEGTTHTDLCGPLCP